ncbi:MAG: hypothetical protein HRU09_17900 [Oligoflexales bacterium]|nr:hypothetical protein [Oligoflexales bacterium]
METSDDNKSDKAVYLGFTSAEPGISPNGQYFATFWEGTISVWDLHSRKIHRELSINNSFFMRSPEKIRISPEGRYLSLIDDIHSAYLIDLTAWAPLLRLKRFNAIATASFKYLDNSDQILALGRSNSGSVIPYDLVNRKLMREREFYGTPNVHYVSLVSEDQIAIASRDKKSIQILSSNNTLRYRAAKATYYVDYDGYEFPLDGLEVTFSADGQKYLYLYEDQNVYGDGNGIIINLEFGALNGDEKSDVKLRMNRFSAICLSPTGKFLAVSNEDMVNVIPTSSAKAKLHN